MGYNMATFRISLVIEHQLQIVYVTVFFVIAFRTIFSLLQKLLCLLRPGKS